LSYWLQRRRAPSALLLGASRVERVSQLLDEQPSGDEPAAGTAPGEECGTVKPGPPGRVQAWLRKLSTSILVALSLVAVASLSLGTIGYAAYRSYQDHLWASLHTKNELLADELAHSLLLPFWNLDRPQMLKIIESTMQDQDLFGVVVAETDPYGETFARVRGIADAVPEAELPRLLSAPGLLKQTREIAFGKEVIGNLDVYVTPARIEHQLRQVQMSMFGAILLLGGIVFLSLYTLLWHNVLRPLKRIEHYAVAVCDGSQSDIPDGGKPLRGEFEVLRSALGRLLNEKVSLYRREHLLNLGLAQQKIALQHALNAREEFLVIASHELKTPITSLQLHIQLLLRRFRAELVNPPMALFSKSLETCAAQVQRLTRLIDGMLDMTSMRSGMLRIQLETMDLTEVIHEVAERLSPELTSARCHLTIDAPPGIRVFWDRARIEQVLTNLMGNAIKYATGSPIQIVASQQGEETTFAVRDKGIGISKDKQGIIFECCERGAAPTSVAGLGLGLYICRRIVEAHGGTIRVESDLGQGAAFVVSIPTRPPPTAEPSSGGPSAIQVAIAR
jgi:signal transduction histidine kinase